MTTQSENPKKTAEFDQAKHDINHFPKDPLNCKFCRIAKLTRKAARRVKKSLNAKRMKKFAERIHLDLIGPTEQAMNGSRYLFNTLDDATVFGKAAGLETKLPPEVLRRFQDMYRGYMKSGTGIRSDNNQNLISSHFSIFKKSFLVLQVGFFLDNSPRRAN